MRSTLISIFMLPAALACRAESKPPPSSDAVSQTPAKITEEKRQDTAPPVPAVVIGKPDNGLPDVTRRGIFFMHGDGQDRDFSDMDLQKGDFRWSNLSGASFKGSDLRQADFQGADLTGADLGGADLTGAVYDDRTQFPARFDPEKRGMLNAMPETVLDIRRLVPERDKARDLKQGLPNALDAAFVATPAGLFAYYAALAEKGRSNIFRQQIDNTGHPVGERTLIRNTTGLIREISAARARTGWSGIGWCALTDRQTAVYGLAKQADDEPKAAVETLSIQKLKDKSDWPDPCHISVLPGESGVIALYQTGDSKCTWDGGIYWYCANFNISFIPKEGERVDMEQKTEAGTPRPNRVVPAGDGALMAGCNGCIQDTGYHFTGAALLHEIGSELHKEKFVPWSDEVLDNDPKYLLADSKTAAVIAMQDNHQVIGAWRDRNPMFVMGISENAKYSGEDIRLLPKLATQELVCHNGRPFLDFVTADNQKVRIDAADPSGYIPWMFDGKLTSVAWFENRLFAFDNDHNIHVFRCDKNRVVRAEI